MNIHGRTSLKRQSKLVEEGYKPLSVPWGGWGATWSHIFFSPISTIQVQPFHMGGWVQPHQVSTMSFLKVCVPYLATQMVRLVACGHLWLLGFNFQYSAHHFGGRSLKNLLSNVDGSFFVIRYPLPAFSSTLTQNIRIQVPHNFSTHTKNDCTQNIE